MMCFYDQRLTTCSMSICHAHLTSQRLQWLCCLCCLSWKVQLVACKRALQPHVKGFVGRCCHALENVMLQELVLRYEALSLAVSQLHMQTQTEPSIHPAAVSSAHGSQQSMPAAAQQQSAYAVGPARDSPRHLLASRQPEKAHEPMFGAAEPQSDAANASGTSALLQVSPLPFRCVAHLVLALGCAQPSHDTPHMRTLAAA